MKKQKMKMLQLVLYFAKKDDIFAKYILGGLSNRVFASKYKLKLPSEKELRLKLKTIQLLKQNKNEKEI